MTSAEMLLEAIGDIGELDGELIRGAYTAKRRRKKMIWATLLPVSAAAAVLAALILPGRLGHIRGDGYTTEKMASMEEVAELYGGKLLAENLVTAGAEIADIRLSHREDGDVSDVSGWDTLDFTANLDGEQVDVRCSFNDPQDEAPSDGTARTLEYAGVTVSVSPYVSPDGTEFDVLSFRYEGVRYDLRIYRDDGHDFEDYLEMVIAPAAPVEPQVTEDENGLGNILGCEKYRVTVDGSAHTSFTWHFLVEIDGEERCVAEHVNFMGEFDVYSVDMDGDGTPELISNNIYGDGAAYVVVYRNVDGVIMEGEIPWEIYRDDYGFDMLVGAACVAEERYDSAANEFVVTNYGSEKETTVSFTGLDNFHFTQFKHLDYN